MNGVHDMGGMHGFGPVEYEGDEPVFHEPWEGRVYALTRAMGAWGKWNIDASRHSRERIPPAEYLRMSYYEKWLAGLTRLLIEHGLVMQAELESGKPASGSPRPHPRSASNRSRRSRPGEASAGTCRRPRVSQQGSGSARATFIPQATFGCRGTRAASWGQSTGTTASSFFRTPTRTFRGRTRSACTRCASRRASCGARKRRREIRCTSTCGTTTLSRPDSSQESSEPLTTLPSLPRDDGGPVFAEPWQAQAFALAVKLSEQGHFTWKEWAAALAAELKAASDSGEPDDGSRYYEHWLAALERLVTSRGLTGTAALSERKEAWADAYRHTPHGKPVALDAGQGGKV